MGSRAWYGRFNAQMTGTKGMLISTWSTLTTCPLSSVCHVWEFLNHIVRGIELLFLYINPCQMTDGSHYPDTEVAPRDYWQSVPPPLPWSFSAAWLTADGKLNEAVLLYRVQTRIISIPKLKPDRNCGLNKPKWHLLLLDPRNFLELNNCNPCIFWSSFDVIPKSELHDPYRLG